MVAEIGKMDCGQILEGLKCQEKELDRQSKGNREPLKVVEQKQGIVKAWEMNLAAQIGKEAGAKEMRQPEGQKGGAASLPKTCLGDAALFPTLILPTEPRWSALLCCVTSDSA